MDQFLSTEPTLLQLCIHCKYVATPFSNNPDNYKCFAPENLIGINYVTGQPIMVKDSCAEIRTKPQCDYFIEKESVVMTTKTEQITKPKIIKTLKITENDI